MCNRFLLMACGWLIGAGALADGAAVFAASAVRADFQELYETLQRAHFDLYVETPKPVYDAAFEAALAQIDGPLTQPEIVTLFQRFVALGRVAHARIEDAGAAFAAHLEAGGGMIPLYVRIRGERAWISEDYSGVDGVAPGDELLSIDGEAVPALLHRMRRGLSADTRYLADTLIELEFPRLVWELLGTAAGYELALRQQGSGRALRVPALSREEIRAQAAALDGQGLELSFSERAARVLPGRIAYLRPGPFYNAGGGELWDTGDFRAFVDAAFARFQAAGADRLLIDLRNNPGGDASFSDLMVAWIADRPFRFYSQFQVKTSEAARASNAVRLGGEDPGAVTQAYAREFAAHAPGEVFSFELPAVSPREAGGYEGEVYALINRHSYSNAVTVAAILKDYGFATLLGEETADLATTLGAMEHFELTRTGIRVGFPKARIVRPSGDPTRRGVVPDVSIETPVVESADDPVLQAALAEVRRRQR